MRGIYPACLPRLSLSDFDCLHCLFCFPIGVGVMGAAGDVFETIVLGKKTQCSTSLVLFFLNVQHVWHFDTIFSFVMTFPARRSNLCFCVGNFQCPSMSCE